jgi:formylglycine-generating enzyme required for sulfatase activity
LPTASEWSEVAKDVLAEPSEPILENPDLGWASAYLVDEARPRGIRLGGAFSVTTDGLADLDGSVWEWAQDCVTPALADRCPAYVVGGQHMAVIPYLERDPARGGCAVGTPPAHLRMRHVSDLAPGST